MPRRATTVPRSSTAARIHCPIRRFSSCHDCPRTISSKRGTCWTARSARDEERRRRRPALPRRRDAPLAPNGFQLPDQDPRLVGRRTVIGGTDLHIPKGGVPTVAPGTVLGHEATASSPKSAPRCATSPSVTAFSPCASAHATTADSAPPASTGNASTAAGRWATPSTACTPNTRESRSPANVVVVDRVAGPRDIALPRADGYDLAGAPLGVLESVFVSSSLTPGVNSVMSYRWRRAP